MNKVCSISKICEGQSQKVTLFLRRQVSSTHLSPPFSDGIAVTIDDREQDDRCKLTPKTRPKPNRQRGHRDGLVLNLDDGVIRRLIAILCIIEQASRVGQGQHDTVEDLGQIKASGKDGAFPEPPYSALNDVLVLRAACESRGDGRNDRPPRHLEHVHVKGRHIAGEGGAWNVRLSVSPSELPSPRWTSRQLTRSSCSLHQALPCIVETGLTDVLLRHDNLPLSDRVVDICL
jgi:hypothetical protein